MSGAFTRILCPTDFSDTAARAVVYADRLAAATGAELMLLHVCEADELFGHGTSPSKPAPLARLDEWRPQFATAVDRVVAAGDPGEVICWIAQHRECDLIVVGTHGRTGLRRLLLGSVAEHVMQHARCAVLTVRDQSADEPPLAKPELRLPQPPPRWL